MRYAEARLTPESNVTQTTPSERRKVPRFGPGPNQQAQAAKTYDRQAAILRKINQARDAEDVMYKMGFQHGWFKGLILGLLIGALSIAILAAVVLGDVLEHF